TAPVVCRCVRVSTGSTYSRRPRSRRDMTGDDRPGAAADRTAAPPPRAAGLDYARPHELRDAARRPAALRPGPVAAARPERAAELRPGPSSRPRRLRPGARRPRPRRPGPRPPPPPGAAHGDARGPVGPPCLGLRPRIP